jgi:hypothetical protein
LLPAWYTTERTRSQGNKGQPMQLSIEDSQPGEVEIAGFHFQAFLLD